MGFWDYAADAASQDTNLRGGAASFFTQTLPDVAKGVFDSTIGAAGNTVGNIYSITNTAMKQQEADNAAASAKSNSSFLDQQVKDNQISQQEADQKKKDDQAKVEQAQQAAKIAEENSNQIDPTKAAGAAAETALNVGTLGVGGLVENAAKTGVEQVAKQTVGQAAKSSIGKIAADTALGAGYGEAGTAATEGKNATPSDYINSGVAGGLTGGAIALIPAGADMLKAATDKTPVVAPSAPPTQVVNGAAKGSGAPDLRPFDQPAQPAVPTAVGSENPGLQTQSGVTTQLPPSDVKLPNPTSDVQSNIAPSQLDALANRPVGVSPADFLRSQQDKPKSMNADITPNQTVLQGNINVTPSEAGPQSDLAQRAASALGLRPEDMKQPEAPTTNVTLTDKEVSNLAETMKGTPMAKAQQLKSAGATDDQIRTAVGVDSNGVAVKPLQITDTPAPTDKYAANLQSDSSLGSKTLADMNMRIEDLKASGKEVPPELQSAVDKLNQAQQSVKGLTGDYMNGKPEPTSFFGKVAAKASDVKDAITSEWEPTVNRFAMRGGEPAATLAHDLQSGERVKQNILNDVQPQFKTADEFTASGQNMGIGEAKAQVERVAHAVESGDASGIKPEDQKLYDTLKSVSEYYTQKRQEMGRAVIGGTGEGGSYVPHVDMSNDKANTENIVSSLMGDNKDPNALSQFSKERTGNQALNVKDGKTLIQSYIHAMTNDLAFGDALQKFKDSKDQIPAALAGDSKNMAAFKKDLQTTVGYALHGTEENAASKITSKALGTMVENALYVNPGNELKNLTDQYRNEKYLSDGYKNVGDINPDIMKEFTDQHGNFTFGIHRNMTDGGTPLSKVGAVADKWNTDRLNVKLTNTKGLQDGFNRSQVYQQAIAEGKSPSEAQDIAWNSSDKEQIIRNVNAVASHQAFGNNLNRPAAFMKGSPLLGFLSPKVVSTFASYPISTSMEFIRNMDPSAAQALEAFGRGDMTGSTAATLKVNADKALKGMEMAVKDPSYPVPPDVAKEHLDLVRSAVEDINKYLGDNSKITRGGTASSYGKIWAATTAIQMAVVGSQDAMFNRQGKNAKQRGILGTALTQNPFLDIGRATNPIVNASPVTGNNTGGLTVNTRAALNLVPYLGGADQLTGSNISNWLKANVQKPANADLTAAYK